MKRRGSHRENRIIVVADTVEFLAVNDYDAITTKRYVVVPWSLERPDSHELLEQSLPPVKHRRSRL